MGNCALAVQKEDEEDAKQIIRRIAIQRRMVGQRLGETILEARNPKNRSRAQTLLGRVKTLQQQHNTLDRVESQLTTITDINSTHTVLTSVSKVFNVDSSLIPNLDDIADIQDTLTESQQACHEVEQALRQGFYAQGDPQTMSDQDIQKELDAILGLGEDTPPQPPAAPSVQETAEKTTVTVKKKTKNLSFPAIPKTAPKPKTPTETTSISHQPSRASGTRVPVTLQQPKGQKPLLVPS